ncbi:methyltransferase [Lentzea sp. NPDC051838]|uniref:methyltransferase n=1 Tax=Lentzea sp. NPDC051838 TaxID=3154849 RepID=UPI003441DA85
MDASRAALDLVTAAWRAQVVHTAAVLQLPDLVAAGHRTSTELATPTGVDASTLRRLLRVLALLGLFEGDDTDGYTVTALGEQLQDRPGSLRDTCLLYGEEFHQAWGHAAESFRTGIPGFELAFKATLTDHLKHTPDAATRFQKGLRASSFFFDAVPDLIDFGARVVDIGGGSGQLLSTVLRATPHARGTYVDLEHMLPVAREHFAATIGTERVDLVALDMFTGTLPEADTYVLSRVLGDWSDDDCVRLLHNVRRAMPPEARLLIIERVVHDGPDLLAPLWDLHLFVVNGGTQREYRTYVDLAARSGFAIKDTVALPMENSALVLVPEERP